MQTLLFSLQIFFCGFAVINALFLESIFEHNTYPGAIGGIILILLSLKLFYDVFEKEEKEFQTAPLIYFNIGIFLYFSVTLLILLLGNYLLKASDTFYYRIWLIRWIADILFYILLAIGLWIHKRK
ncbi:MAG: hypothetical protein GQ574_02115 [Crocinitomix sp.]|nr:hypothetical protein [Crocinitomix sp.]